MRFNAQASAVTNDSAPVDLAAENARLQRLVADLLIKNQQLRAALQSTLEGPRVPHSSRSLA